MANEKGDFKLAFDDGQSVYLLKDIQSIIFSRMSSILNDISFNLYKFTKLTSIFFRKWANLIPKPFVLHYNPYTQNIETLDRKDQVLKLIQEIRGELDQVSTALVKQ